jgi:predicted metallo-beta-lactamase superfamily hydrolase
MLVSPSQNPVRNQCYKAQIKFHDLDVKPRIIQRNLKRYIYQGQRYKQAYVSKSLSLSNCQERINYSQEHQDKTIENFWQYIVFTNKAYINPTSTLQGYILREEGRRYNSENIQERGEKKGVKLYIAAWINWHKKADKLEFYNDEQDSIIRPKRPPKPRKTIYKLTDDFQHRCNEGLGLVLVKSLSWVG